MAMRDLLYFNPDPEVPDADLLGIGDLIYSDGSTQYVNDLELTAGLPGLPPGVSPQGAGMAPSARGEPMGPPMPPIELEGADGPVQLDPNTGNLSPLTRGLNALGNTLAGAPGADSSQPGLGNMLGDAVSSLGRSLTPASAAPEPEPAPQQGPPPVTLQGPQGPVTMDATGNMTPGGGGVPVEQLQQQMGGMIPVQREGALPADVAARQAQEMGAMNAQTLAATEQARAEEARLYNELVLKQMAANEAERVSREQELADNQARAERLRAEVQRTNELGLDRTVNGSMGEVSGTLGIIGAMLMGAAGNQAGFRMLEGQVDRHVNEQVNRKDTALRMLANELGSTQQAIAAGKAALYKVAADKTELLAAKTKSDVFAAQTPAVIQALRQKQLEEMQKFEQLSLGKTIEKAPLPPKPPSEEMLNKYGQLRRDRDAGINIGQRVEQQLGLIWEPGQGGQPGRYRNKDEVLAKGIQGIGNLEQWLPDAVYSTMGGVTAEGYQVRGAAEAMAYATIRQLQPVGPISNADIKAAVKAGALDTEQGMLMALERIRTGAEEARQHDAAQFGPDVVREYDRRFQQSGGGAPGIAPAASRPATIEEMRSGAAAARAGAQPQATAPVELEQPQQRMAALNESLATIGQEKQIPPEGIAILMAQAGHETADGARMPTNNFFGMKSSGRNRAGGAGSANLETTEGQGAGARRVRQDFATFESPAASATDMVSLLERKYPRAYEALLAGDVDAYVAALADGGYFTGNEDQYRSALLRRL